MMLKSATLPEYSVQLMDDPMSDHEGWTTRVSDDHATLLDPGTGLCRFPTLATAAGTTPEQRADALYNWLTSRNNEELPRCSAILKCLPCMSTPGALFRAFHLLVVQGRIEQRHGTRGTTNGHRIVLVVATGKILKTAGCPLAIDGPPNRPSHAVADATLRRVMEIVEGCAARSLYLPSPERLGQRIGRSGDIARLALCELHDSGQLTLIQRGMRRAAELPDGRRTL